MRTRKQWTSLLLVISMLFGLFIGGKENVSAASITNLKLSPDLILSWDPVDGANTYKVQLPFVQTETEKTTFDLGAFMKEKRVASGTIYLSLIAEYRVPNTYNYQYIASASLSFNYTSPLPALPSPTNIRIENDRLTWDEVKPANGAVVTYDLSINDYPDVHSKRITTTKNYVDVLDFAYEGTKTYTISIIAKAEGNQDSVQVSPRITYTLTLPALQNLQIKNGYLCWDEFEGAQVVELTTKYGGSVGVAANKQFNTYNGTSYINLAAHVKSERVPVGGTAVIQITARREIKNGNSRDYQNISKTMSCTYTYVNETFPLKFYGQNLSTVENRFSNQYLPFAGVLILGSLYDFDDYTIPSGAVYNAVFESDQPLTVVGGNGALVASAPLFAVNAKLTFENCGSFSVRSRKDTAVKANSLYINGQKITITSQMSGKDAVVTTNEIVFSKSFKSADIKSVEASALTSKNSKIELNGLNILTPDHGTLGSDKKHVYKSDGKTVASEILLSAQTPTPTPTKKPTNTPTNTPTPTKAPSSPPPSPLTPTKKPTNTPTNTPASPPIPSGYPTNTPTPAPTMPSYSFPTNVQAKPATTTSIDVSWGAVGDTVGYELWMSTTENGTYILVGTTEETSYRRTGLNTGVRYYFKVRAWGNGWKGMYSEIVNSTPKISEPRNVSAEPISTTSIKISWNAVSDADGYVVYRSVYGENSFVSLGKVTETSKVSTALTSGTVYEYKVKSYKRENGSMCYSDFSSVIKASPLPNQPHNVKAEPLTKTSITVSWDAVEGATEYEIWRATSQNGSYFCEGTTRETSYRSVDLRFGVRYYYKVRALRGRNAGAFSMPTCSITKISAPNGLKAEASSPTSIEISWNAVSGVDGYQVWRASSQNSDFVCIGSVTDTSKLSIGLTSDKEYEYKVRSYKKIDGTTYYGVFSSIIKGTPKPQSPIGVTAAPSSAKSIKVNWSSVPGATGYEVYRSTSTHGTYYNLGYVTTTSRDCPGLNSGTRYYFKVRAYKEYNGKKIYSDYSTIVSAVPRSK